jgi:hypothetical protein
VSGHRPTRDADARRLTRQLSSPPHQAPPPPQHLIVPGADDPESAYGEALTGLVELLGLVDEKRWRGVLAKHLDDWTRTGDVRSHLGVYGGMGSLDDLYLTRATAIASRRHRRVG